MTTSDFLMNLAKAGLQSGTPLMLVAVGETLAERSGVLNLGLEGVLLLSAMTGVAAASASGSPELGLVAGALAGCAMALVHAWLCLTLRADQVVAGLAMVFVGTGLSSVGGAPLIALREAVPQFRPLAIPGLSDIPVMGPLLFDQPAVVYLALLLTLAIHLFLRRSRWGLWVVACGEDPHSAAVAGIPVHKVRLLSLLAGGVLAGLAGASLSLAITPGWTDGLSHGQGWIAIGLVIVGGWNPVWVAAAAVFFGMVSRLVLDVQGIDSSILRDPGFGHFLAMLPYLAAILVLVGVGWAKRSSKAPSALGIPYQRNSGR